MRLFGLVVLLVGLVVASAPGQDEKPEFPILIASPRPSEKVKVTVEEKVVTKITVGKEDKAETKTKSLVYEDDILAGDPAARLPTNLKRKYEKAVIGTDGSTIPLVLQGQTVSIEKRGDKYVYAVDKKAVMDRDARELLDNEFNTLNRVDARDLMFKGAGAVKVGGTWPIDGALFGGVLFPQDQLQVEKSKVTAKGTLVSAGKPDKRPHNGIVKVEFAATIKHFGEKGFIKAKEGSLNVTITGDGVIDGTSPAGTVTSDMKLKVNGSTSDGIEVAIDMHVTEKRTTELLSKK